MALLRNTNPLGDIVLYGRLREAGEEFEVPDAIAKGLLEQVGNYEDVTPKKAKPAAKKES